MVTRPAARRVVAGLLGIAIGRRRGAPGHGTAAALDRLERDGVAPIEDLLSGADIAEMRGWLSAQDHGADGAYPLATVLQCPHVMRVAQDPRAISLAEAYIGCRATLSSIGIRWSLPRAATTDVNDFHRDPDDWRFVKVFVYLTDVDAGSGPHVYVLGSHRRPGRLRAQPYRAAALAQDYAPEAFHQVLGRAGTSFIADTYGIHKGTIPAERPRLMLLMQYSVLPNFSLLYEPTRLPGQAPPVDRYLMRLFVA